jgi:cyclase
VRISAALSLIISAAVTVSAQQPMVRMFVPESHLQPAAAFGSVRRLPVRGGIHLVRGPGGNTTLQVGDDGVVVVDTGPASSAPDLVEAIRTLSPRPIRQIINTHVHDDHTGGNGIVARAGRFIGSAQARPAFTFLGSAAGAPILAFETVLSRMSAAPSGGSSSIPSDTWPTETYFTQKKELYVNGESIQLLHQPAAHSDSDTVVYFRRSDVLSTGDVFSPGGYPVIDIAQGGSIKGLLTAINSLIDIAVPDFNEEGGTLVIPGRGRICDEADLSDYRDMVTIVRDRVQDMVSKRATLEQITAARLTRDYDGVYESSSYTGQMFVEAVYRSLTQTAARPGGAR